MIGKVYQSRLDADRPENQHVRYLNWLKRQNRGQIIAADKRANWLHFCRRCGLDISDRPKQKQLCAKCQANAD